MLHVRVTDELKARLEAEARAAGRSMNAEIVLRLRDSLRLPSKDDSERVREVIERLADPKVDWKTALRDIVQLLDSKD